MVKNLVKIIKLIFITCFIIFAIFFIFKIIFPTQIEYITHQKKEIKCDRKEPYKIAPEFERARSLRLQRKEEAGIKIDYSFYNCINIQYKELENAYGMFMFDKNSTIDNLTIFVSPEYKVKDDLLLTLLLDHEFAHLNQFLEELKTGVKKDCLDAEVDARLGTIVFLMELNKEEINSLDSKFILYKEKTEYEDTYNIIREMNNLVYLSYLSDNYCSNKYSDDKEQFDCYIQYSKQLIRQYLIENKAYEKQCSL